MNSLVGETHHAPVGGSKILNASIVVNEMVDAIEKNGKNRLLFKLDIEEVYDCISWLLYI